MPVVLSSANRQPPTAYRRPSSGVLSTVDCRLSTSSGFTLIEVLAAFAIIAIVLPTVAKGISICVKAEAQARALIEVSALAHGKLSELSAYPGWEGQTLSGDFSPEHSEYRWTAASSTYQDNLLEVVVVVTWTEAAIERSWSLSTFVYQPVTQ